MRAKVKGFHSPDIQELANYAPTDPQNFAFQLQIMIGPIDQEGAESFDVEVVTPKWLLDRFESQDVLIGRHRLIVFEYNFDCIVKTVERFVEMHSGDNWNQLALKLSCLGRWEFEDYTDV